MVGNDIIDIAATKRSKDPEGLGWKRPGFVEKIFTESEQKLIVDSEDPFITVWQLWSIKESAYKVFIQAGGEAFYNPKRFECELEGLNGKVEIEDLILETESIINENYIFSTAFSDNSEIKSSIFELPESDIQQQSDLIRQQLIKEFSKNNNINSDDLEIRKTESGVPLIYFKDEVLDVSISITHHGEFGGYSYKKVI